MISSGRLKKEFGKCNIIRGTLYPKNSCIKDRIEWGAGFLAPHSTCSLESFI
jgi:hypothetical protein